jgi:hypothetical protein
MPSVITITTPKGRSVTYRPSAKAEAEIDGLYAKHAPGHATHDELVQIMIAKPTDFDPWGNRTRDDPDTCHNDCSCGCNFYHVLDGEVRSDWGVCTNPKSPRVGLLTFEHQGCPEWTLDPRWDAMDKEEMKILRRDKREQAKAKG